MYPSAEEREEGMDSACYWEQRALTLKYNTRSLSLDRPSVAIAVVVCSNSSSSSSSTAVVVVVAIIKHAEKP